MIPFSTYLRIETKAGGSGASTRSLLKATKSMLRADITKAQRHSVYRDVLEHQTKCAKVMATFRL